MVASNAITDGFNGDFVAISFVDSISISCHHDSYFGSDSGGGFGWLIPDCCNYNKATTNSNSCISMVSCSLFVPE